MTAIEYKLTFCPLHSDSELVGFIGDLVFHDVVGDGQAPSVPRAHQTERDGRRSHLVEHDLSHLSRSGYKVKHKVRNLILT